MEDVGSIFRNFAGMGVGIIDTVSSVAEFLKLRRDIKGLIFGFQSLLFQGMNPDMDEAINLHDNPFLDFNLFFLLLFKADLMVAILILLFFIFAFQSLFDLLAWAKDTVTCLTVEGPSMEWALNAVAVGHFATNTKVGTHMGTISIKGIGFSVGTPEYNKILTADSDVLDVLGLKFMASGNNEPTVGVVRDCLTYFLLVKFLSNLMANIKGIFAVISDVEEDSYSCEDQRLVILIESN
eukprot:CAMPEP_0114603072 /NCGR_PEP_ID=MMETSP0125-20121206/25546_1 /TAXON_ID=485358 ORGANISM="Aristerostoma sp., Strain ATCC 50986" /NCGR_SAMPLE_ID=MMETSP0125 /ASSEMBLY_ACC=CAM_ASM_000245 /LENGTH=237 /DNA_ID=CAMNT_0001813645 /DNA_START=624 /DNA_END=1337 /DNA_ORIENTATION=+